MNENHHYPAAIDLAQPDGAVAHIEIRPRKVEITVDLVGHLWIDGVRTDHHLTIREAQVLRAIMSNATVTTFDFLLSYIYGGRDEPETKILTVFVHKLRKKLGRIHGAPTGGAIETVWGRGWSRGANYTMTPERTSTIDIPIDLALVDRLMLHTGLQAADCVGLAIRETVARLEAI